jgi:hypothetical protein
MRNGIVSIEWIKGHDGCVGNKKADELATLGSEKAPNNGPGTPDLPFTQNGTRLSTLTQSTIMKLIIQESAMKNHKKNHRAIENLNHIRDVLRALDCPTPNDNLIWYAIIKNKKDLNPNLRNFLWKLVHSAHKDGTYWSKIPGCEDRAQCAKCDVPESMNHIIFECPHNQGPKLWAAVRSMSLKKGVSWPDNMGIYHIMAAPLIVIKKQDGTIKHGASRFFRMAILECAWQTWKLRCKRILRDVETGEPKISLNEAMNTYKAAMNEKLNQDRNLTNRKKYRNSTLPEWIVLHTWSGTLESELSLPENWLKCNGVLVGIPDPPWSREPHTER